MVRVRARLPSSIKSQILVVGMELAGVERLAQNYLIVPSKEVDANKPAPFLMRARSEMMFLWSSNCSTRLPTAQCEHVTMDVP